MGVWGEGWEQAVGVDSQNDVRVFPIPEVLKCRKIEFIFCIIILDKYKKLLFHVILIDNSYD